MLTIDVFEGHKELHHDEVDAAVVVYLKREYDPTDSVPGVYVHYHLQGFVSGFEAVGLLDYALQKLRIDLQEGADSPSDNGHQADGS